MRMAFVSGMGEVKSIPLWIRCRAVIENLYGLISVDDECYDGKAIRWS